MSYEQSPPIDGGALTRLTQGKMNESWNNANISRITGAKGMMDISSSNFIDDSKMMEMLNNDNMFDEIDMGQIDDEDRQFLLIDKDTGKVYDMRNEMHLQRLQEKQTRLTSDLSTSNSQSSQSQKAWSDWWKQKRGNNQDFILAAEYGNLEEIKRLLDKEKLQDLVADVNNKGLD